MNINIEEAKRISMLMNSKKPASRHIIIKLSEVKDRES